MKRLVPFIFIIGFFLAACDPEECTKEVISNKTNFDIYVKRYSSDPLYSDQFLVEKNSSEEVGEILCSKGGVVISYAVYDSVLLESVNGEILKAFYPQSQGKNIFNEREDWKEEKIGKRSYQYTFEITDADIPISDTEE